jgi:hypothetical protein
LNVNLIEHQIGTSLRYYLIIFCSTKKSSLKFTTMVPSRKKIPVCLLFASLFLFSACVDSSTNPDSPEQANFDSQQVPGTSVGAFLTNNPFSQLQVEVDYMPGQEPRAEALDSLAAFFLRRLNKEAITINTPSQIPSGGQESYATGNLKELENQHRDQFTESGTGILRAYILIVDGSYVEQSLVLGTAYYNTSAALFGPKIEQTNANPGTPSKVEIEASVLQHAFGHVLGLVGNGTPMQSDHQTGGTHCTVEGCLMSPGVGLSVFYGFGFNENIPRLDPLCVRDLQAQGGG